MGWEGSYCFLLNKHTFRFRDSISQSQRIQNRAARIRKPVIVPILQLVPSQPGAHKHLKESPSSLQVPPLLHVVSSHWLSPGNQKEKRSNNSDRKFFKSQRYQGEAIIVLKSIARLAMFGKTICYYNCNSLNNSPLPTPWSQPTSVTTCFFRLEVYPPPHFKSWHIHFIHITQLSSEMCFHFVMQFFSHITSQVLTHNLQIHSFYCYPVCQLAKHLTKPPYSQASKVFRG